MICAKTPQARGRVERANRTLQDRLVELGFETDRRSSRPTPISKNIGSNIVLGSLAYRKTPSTPVRSLTRGLEKLLTYTVRRKVFKDLSHSFNNTFEETPFPSGSSKKSAGSMIIRHPLWIITPWRGSSPRETICEVEPHHFQRNSHVMAGFRNHFRQPGADAVWSRDFSRDPRGPGAESRPHLHQQLWRCRPDHGVRRRLQAVGARPRIWAGIDL